MSRLLAEFLHVVSAMGLFCRSRASSSAQSSAQPGILFLMTVKPPFEVSLIAATVATGPGLLLVMRTLTQRQ